MITPFAAFVGALIAHYLLYAYRFMWYLDHRNFTLLVSAYLAFLATMVPTFLFAPRWWLMGPLALLVMFVPPVLGIEYYLPIGPTFVGAAIASALPFVGVAYLRSRPRRAQ